MTIRFAAASLSALAFALATPLTPAFADNHAAAPQATADLPALVQQVQIPFEEFQLDNGLTVIVHEDRKAPVVGV
ncbi:MAG: hypothetical protein C0471_15865, partial [Erythrobacter sp.]|nr:hypothetical protein [Erythrobacter sp.]